MQRRGCVITGVGAVSPLAVGAEETFAAWLAGNCAIAAGAAHCDRFDPGAALSRKEARRSDRVSQLALVAAQEALADAGWEGATPHDPGRVGCVIGSGVGGLATLSSQQDVLRQQGAKRMSPLTVPMMMANAPSALVAMRYGLRGPNFGTVSACAAGAHAIGVALRMIQCGDADAVVAGGAEAALIEFGLGAFRAMEALSPSGVSRPFDARRDGFVMGEGAGILVLEDAELARARGARILGHLVGYGANADASHLTAPSPDGSGAAAAIGLALRDAELQPWDIDYVNAHGTSTPLNDRAETAALKLALGEHAGAVPVSSLKSATGHLLGASGAMEAIVTALGLRDAVAGPTLGYEVPEPGLDLDYVPDGPAPLRKLRPRADGAGPLNALSNSFGFGGHNAVLCMSAVTAQSA